MAAVVLVICSASSASFLSFFLSLMVLYLHCIFQPKPPRCRINPLHVPWEPVCLLPV